MVGDPQSSHTGVMQIASYEIDVAEAGLVVTPVVLLAALVVWLLLATGAVGRIVLFCEELAHRRSARTIVLEAPSRDPRIESALVEHPGRSGLR